jgi:hypothetical protein
MMMSTLDEIIARVSALPPGEQDAVWKDAAAQVANMRFVPNPGPQTEAYLSEADVLLYGGQAGGGKTYLELGWGVNEARSGIIFRRGRNQTDGLEKEGKVLIGTGARFNGTDLEWTWADGKTLKLAGMQLVGDWNDHAGRERDYMAFDEGGEFLEIQVASIMAWLRAEPGRRTRVIIGSNPPRSSDGLWLIRWFAPWLDVKFPNPAVPGELRWAIYVSRGDDSEMIWVDGPGEYEIDGEKYLAKSYTFIPASLADNPQRNTPEYRAQLSSLPEPLRSQLLYGKFSAAMKDAANQTCPTAWVQLAQERWSERPPRGVPMCAIGVDASGGGNDPMIMAPRYDGYYPPLIEVPASDIPIHAAGSYCAGRVVATRQHRAEITIDMGGGYGGPMYEKLVENDIEPHRYKGAEKTTRRSRDGQLKFFNVRSAALWQFREALDPDQPGGSPIMLPPDQRLLSDLTAPTFKLTPNGIQVESKEDVCKRLGRSTDRGDAVMMAWFHGARALTHGADWIGLEPGRRNSLARKPTLISSGRQPLSAPRAPLSAKGRK